MLTPISQCLKVFPVDLLVTYHHQVPKYALNPFAKNGTIKMNITNQG